MVPERRCSAVPGPVAKQRLLLCSLMRLALGQRMVSAGNGIDADVQTSDKTHAPNTAILAMADVTSANYLRIPTLDQPGVFAQVTQALSEYSISIDAAIQHEASASQPVVDIVLLTKQLMESVMNAALERLQGFDIVAADIVRLRVAPAL